MNISERERKMLLILAVLLVVVAIFYLIKPKIENITQLKADIKTAESSVENLETQETGFESNLSQLNEEIAKHQGSRQERLHKLESLQFYKTISDGEKIVEINSFIPVSESDKFVIEELQFLSDEQVATGSSSEKVVGEGTVTQVSPSTTSDESTEQSTETAENSETTETSEENDDELTGNSVNQVLAENGFEPNFTKLVFSGYYNSLVKFVDNIDNNEEFVVVVGINISNIGLTDPTRVSNILLVELILSFPTYTGSNINNDINNRLNDQYVNSTNDPFNPYNGFSLIEDVTNTGNSNGSGVSDEDKEEFKVLESFNKNPYFFVTNDNRNGGYVSTTQQSTDGNPSLKLYYDFYNRNNKNIAYAVSEKENIVLSNTPEQILVDVFNDSSNENEFGIVFRDATGVEKESVVFSALDFNGWSTTTIPLPDNMVYPVTIQRFYVKSSGSGVKQEGTVLIDNLRIVEYK